MPCGGVDNSTLSRPLSHSTEEADVGVSLVEDSTSPLQDKSSPKVAGAQDPNASVCVVS